ncbi:hypothetical protein B0T24DRAFT_229126 [Lasiosphaeria ovina]|uniref:Uncharacterized protein n=1 Tax=Lasiosphaeria ovina TaxID=92902 RepID=A0AAE0KHD5_9PEZI|nr:hypothetical protein B0T24DRAFT_229126 [Lasiosphaeria ovina]
MAARLPIPDVPGFPSSVFCFSNVQTSGACWRSDLARPNARPKLAAACMSMVRASLRDIPVKENQRLRNQRITRRRYSRKGPTVHVSCSEYLQVSCRYRSRWTPRQETFGEQKQVLSGAKATALLPVACSMRAARSRALPRARLPRRPKSFSHTTLTLAPNALLHPSYDYQSTIHTCHSLQWVLGWGNEQKRKRRDMKLEESQLESLVPSLTY